jgi:hypothetical protein
MGDAEALGEPPRRQPGALAQRAQRAMSVRGPKVQPHACQRAWCPFSQFAIGCAMASTPARAGRLRRPKPDRQRALQLLAACPQEGCTQAILVAHGFTVEQMVELVRAGLATATPQRVTAGRHKMEVAVLRITDEGRRALAKAKA